MQPQIEISQAGKAPLPRQLTEKETFESLKHWFANHKNYYRRDALYEIFMEPDFTWNPTAANFGLQAETTGRRRTAARLKADLIILLEITCGFLPHSYVTERVLNECTSWEDVKRVFQDIYGLELSSESFLELTKIKRLPSETPRQFFERLDDYVNQHKTGPNVTVHGVATAQLAGRGGELKSYFHLRKNAGSTSIITGFCRQVRIFNQN